MLFCEFELTTAKQLFVLVQVCFDVSELFQQQVVLQNLEIFDMEVSLVISLQLFARLSWVNPFEYTKSSEVLQTDLEISNGV